LVIVKKEIKEINKDLTDNFSNEFYKQYKPEISNMLLKTQKLVADQKSENFKFMKEIAVLEKGKVELQNAIYACLGKIHQLEKYVGIKAKAFTYAYDQSMIDTDINGKVIIDREDI